MTDEIITFPATRAAAARCSTTRAMTQKVRPANTGEVMHSEIRCGLGLDLPYGKRGFGVKITFYFTPKLSENTSGVKNGAYFTPYSESIVINLSFASR